MLTMSDMKYFIEPTPNHYEVDNSDRVLIFQTRYNRRQEECGTVADLAPKSSRRITFSDIDFVITAGGDHVRGAVNKPTNVYYHHVVGTSPAYPDRFFAGYVENMVAGEGADRGVALGRTRVSTGESHAAGEWSGVLLNDWYRAAPWAMDLMPQPADTAEYAAAKLALAKERWEFNYALSVITAEGMYRDWNGQLEVLANEFGWLPSYHGTSFITGTALIPVNRDALTSEERDRFAEQREEFQQRTGRTLSQQMTTYAEASVEVVLEAIRPMKHGRLVHPYSSSDVNHAVRSALGVRNGSVDPHYAATTMLARSSSHA